MIGSWGQLVFQVSDKRARTFRDAQREGTARWATHDHLAGGFRREFLGWSPQTLSLTVDLRSDLGVDPPAELARLRLAKDTGAVEPLILGDEYLGDFALVALADTWETVDARGRIQAATATLSLEEYE